MTASVSEILPECVNHVHVKFMQADDVGKGGMKPVDMAAMAARIR